MTKTTACTWILVLIVAVQAAAQPDIDEPNEGPESLKVNIEQALLLALDNNRSLAMQRLTPSIQATYERQQGEEFEPTLSGSLSQRRNVSDRLSRAGSNIDPSVITDSRSGTLSLAKLFSTGTTAELQGTSNYTDSSLYSDSFTSNRLGVTVTQALLQGRDLRSNLARVHQARLETQISAYELHGFTEALVLEVETAFWDMALAQRQINIYQDSLNLAEQQMGETRERIAIGQLAETELAAAQAEVALRRENLINARSTLALQRLNLLRLLNPTQSFNWDMEVALDYETVVPEIALDDIEQHVQVALQQRPDLNQARLQCRINELEVVRTRNGMLPRLDLFVDFGRSGYGNKFSSANRDIDTGGYDVTAGLLLEQSVSNRANRARRQRAVLSKSQQLLAVANLEQLIQVEVRSAYIEVHRNLEQITATGATRTFQEEKLRAETEKFRVGKSTSLLVAAAQRDLVASQIAEIEAVANYLKALIQLYQSEGALLQRRGIEVPPTH